jgi:hypothetical protein
MIQIIVRSQFRNLIDVLMLLKLQTMQSVAQPNPMNESKIQPSFEISLCLVAGLLADMRPAPYHICQ